MSQADDPLAALRAGGRRITAQRRLVLDVIAASDAHLDAEAVYRRAHARDPRISLATVYRTLAMLKETGLIEQRYLAAGHAREHYEPIGAPEHYHFTCLGCGRAIEFQSARVKQMRADVRRTLGLDVTRVCVCVQGYCKACAARRSPGKTARASRPQASKLHGEKD